MLFLQFVLYLPSIVGTRKHEIPGAALDMCKLNIEQFSTGILKFSTNHEDNPFTLNCSKISWTFLFIFYAGSHGLGSKNFRNSNYKKKRPIQPVFPRLSFRFLWLWFHLFILEMQLILESRDQTGHTHFGPCPPKNILINL